MTLRLEANGIYDPIVESQRYICLFRLIPIENQLSFS